MSTNQSTQEADKTLTDLGIHISDLSAQPQTFKGITKKLMQLAHAAEAAEQATTTAPVDVDIDEQIAKIKDSIPEWAFEVTKPGDGRVATPVQEEEASATLDELEDFINSAASMESLMDVQFAIEQANILMQHQFYKLDKLDDYEYNLLKTRMTSQADYQGLSQLGVGIESSLPHVSMFTQTPSPVNYGSMKTALEAKKEGLSKILSVVGGTIVKIVFVVLAQVLVAHLFMFLNYWISRGLNLLRDANNRRKNKKRVNINRLRRELSDKNGTTYKQPKPGSGRREGNDRPAGGEMKSHLDKTNYTETDISLAKLYEDTTRATLANSNLDDLFKAGTPKNLDGLQSLWGTMQEVLKSVQDSIAQTTKEMETSTMIAKTEEPVVNPEKLEQSLITVNAITGSFQKYESVHTDTQEGLDILANLSKIYKKGDITRFEADVKVCKAQLAKLDTLFKAKAQSEELPPELRNHLARRIYLLRVASDYLTKNINLQVRFQKLALAHISIFEKMAKDADEILDIVEKMSDPDNDEPVVF